MGDDFRRYLETRISLGDPPMVLPELSRRQARRLARRLARRELEGEGAPTPRGEASEREPSAVSTEPTEPGTRAAAGSGTGAAPSGGGSPAAGSGTGGTDTGPASPAEDRWEPPDPSEDVPDFDLGSPSLADEEIRRLSEEGTGEEIDQLRDMATLQAVAEGCVRCPLHEARRQVVFGEGDPDADVVCVGEAPGAREDETGRPFVGPAGKLLDQLLLSVGFRRSEVYICNVLKSRPPNNRDPRDEEIEACAPFLLRQIELIDPAVIIAFGAFAARTLLGVRDSLGDLRGRTHLFQGYPLVATYHPAALLRNRSWTRPTWEDLQLVRQVVEGEAGHEAAEQLGLM